MNQAPSLMQRRVTCSVCTPNPRVSVPNRFSSYRCSIFMVWHSKINGFNQIAMIALRSESWSTLEHPLEHRESTLTTNMRDPGLGQPISWPEKQTQNSSLPKLQTNSHCSNTHPNSSLLILYSSFFSYMYGRNYQFWERSYWSFGNTLWDIDIHNFDEIMWKKSKI